MEGLFSKPNENRLKDIFENMRLQGVYDGVPRPPEVMPLWVVLY